LETNLKEHKKETIVNGEKVKVPTKEDIKKFEEKYIKPGNKKANILNGEYYRNGEKIDIDDL
jgi:hypothetical protein